MKDTSIIEAQDEYQRRKNAVIMEVMQELYARLPYDQEFTLADGSRCKLQKLAAPRICQREGHQYEGAAELAFDVVIEDGKLDHLEFYCFNTGGGGFA